MEKKDVVKALVTAVLTAIVGLVFKYIDPPTILTEIWQRVFVGPWFIWLGVAVYGLYWFARFLTGLHRTMTKGVPALIEAQTGLIRGSNELIQNETSSRISFETALSNRINALDTRITGDLKNLRQELQSELSEAIRKESHQRTEGINALIRQLEAQAERMNRIETTLPAQVNALKRRFDKIESPPPVALNRETYKDLIDRAGLPGVGESAVSAALLGTTPSQDEQNATLAALHEIERKKPS